MSKARLVLHEKQIDEDGSIVEAKIWSVPVSSAHRRGVKYSVVYMRDGKRILGYDNAHGRDHKHYREGLLPYRFRSIRALLRDFRRDLSRIKREAQR